MKQHDEFIAAFKELEEAIVKVHPKVGENRETSPVRWAEDNYPDKASKLRYCRNTRNYIQHEGDYENFIEVSPSMISFLKEFTGELVGTAKSLSKTLRTSSVLPTDTVYDACKKMKKNSAIVVCDQENVYGILKDGDVKLAVATDSLTKRSKVSSIMGPASSVGEVKDSDSGEKVVKKLSTYEFLIVKNKQGKIIGIISR